MAQVVSAVLASPDDNVPASVVAPPIPDGLTPRQQLFAYVMACGAPSIRAIGTLVIRAAFAILLLVIALLLASGH